MWVHFPVYKEEMKPFSIQISEIPAQARPVLASLKVMKQKCSMSEHY